MDLGALAFFALLFYWGPRIRRAMAEADREREAKELERRREQARIAQALEKIASRDK